jgi:Zn-dependent protease with chaperone function
MNEDKATRYQRLKRQASILSFIWNVALLGGLLATGATFALRDAAEAAAARIAAPSWLAPVSVVVYVVLFSALDEIGGLAIAFYSGWIVERRYGLSTQRIRGWIADQAKAFGVGLALAAGSASIVYWLIRRSPQHWWIAAGAVFALLIVVMANLVPVLLLPLFYHVKPLDRESLRERLLGLAERAGARVLGAYEWGLADKTKKANAALAGIGSTRRILVSDTMLAEYSDDEIEVVLAHELAHHVHGDIWKGIAFESALVLIAFCVASQVMNGLAGWFGLRGVADVAGLPLLVLATGGVALVTVPLAHAMSRTYERSADRFALTLTRNPGAFISAMRRLGAQNLAEENPSKVVQWLFYSHPPVRERIEAAQAFGAR